MTSNDTSAVLAGPDTDIHAVFDEVSSAWEDGDTNAFVAWYADDATAILPAFYLPGKEAIRTSMAAAFAGPLKGSRRIHQVRASASPGQHSHRLHREHHRLPRWGRGARVAAGARHVGPVQE